MRCCKLATAPSGQLLDCEIRPNQSHLDLFQRKRGILAVDKARPINRQLLQKRADRRTILYDRPKLVAHLSRPPVPTSRGDLDENQCLSAKTIE